jgi:competence protein ComEA
VRAREREYEKRQDCRFYTFLVQSNKEIRMNRSRLAIALLWSLLVSFSLWAMPLAVDAESQTNHPSVDKKINLNTADVVVLTHSFKRIGVKRAEAIVHYREAHARFNSVEELALIRGLGLAFVKRNLAQLDAVFCVD